MKSVKLLLRFPAEKTTKPLSYHLVKDYDLVFNIFMAQINAGERGELALELSGHEENIEKGIKFMEDEGVEVTLLSKSVSHNDELCISCGLCTSVCPTEALSIVDDKLLFDSEKCVVCQMCVLTCPLRSMSIHYTDD